MWEYDADKRSTFAGVDAIQLNTKYQTVRYHHVETLGNRLMNVESFTDSDYKYVPSTGDSAEVVLSRRRDVSLCKHCRVYSFYWYKCSNCNHSKCFTCHSYDESREESWNMCDAEFNVRKWMYGKEESNSDQEYDETIHSREEYDKEEYGDRFSEQVEPTINQLEVDGAEENLVIERVLGRGNQTDACVHAGRIMSFRNTYDEYQKEIILDTMDHTTRYHEIKTIDNCIMNVDSFTAYEYELVVAESNHTPKYSRRVHRKFVVPCEVCIGDEKTWLEHRNTDDLSYLSCRKHDGKFGSIEMGEYDPHEGFFSMTRTYNEGETDLKERKKVEAETLSHLTSITPFDSRIVVVRLVYTCRPTTRHFYPAHGYPGSHVKEFRFRKLED